MPFKLFGTSFKSFMEIRYCEHEKRKTFSYTKEVSQ